MTCEWGKITVAEILTPVGGTLESGAPNRVFTGISTDSRKIEAGNLFWPLRGERFDGHDFIPSVLSGDATGTVAEKKYINALRTIPSFGEKVIISVRDTLAALGDLAAWWRRQHPVKVIAITGSAGKTTTKEMVSIILSPEMNVLKNPGNFNNLIGLPLTILSMNQNHHAAVLEMGMNRFGEISRLSEISDPDVGVITNVGMAHLEGVGSLEGVARAKAELAQKMSNKGILVVNGDSPELLSEVSRYKKDILTFGLGKGNQVRGKDIRPIGRIGSEFEACYDGVCWTVKLHVPGTHMVYNALAAMSACLAIGLEMDTIVKNLEKFMGVEGRFHVKALPGEITLIDDTYNASPTSLDAALRSAARMKQEHGKLIVAVGDMLELGVESERLHRDVGRTVAEVKTDFLVAMGKETGALVKGALDAGMPGSHAVQVDSHEEMVESIKRKMGQGAVVLIKGSHRMELDKVVALLVAGMKKDGTP